MTPLPWHIDAVGRVHPIAYFQLLPVTVTDRPIETAPARASGLIEIEPAGGYRVRIGSGIKASALRLVLDVLERR